MKCPACGGFDARCIDSRETPDGRRRRYTCPCSHRFSTIEVAVDIKPGRPGMPRIGSTIGAAMNEKMQVEADRKARAKLREALGINELPET